MILKVFRNFLIVLAVLVVLARPILGFWLWNVGDALVVAVGLGAKLGCSGYYVTGMTPAKIVDDLADYSPATRLLEMDYTSEPNKVTATMFNSTKASATFRPGIGCTLDVGDTSAIDEIRVSKLKSKPSAWPEGAATPDISRDWQRTADERLSSDNDKGMKTRALAVVSNGKLVAESYAEGIDANTRILGWSMGKSITAMLIGRAEHLGLLSNSDEALFPEWQSDERQDIRLKHLLQMSSGLAFDETYAPGSDSTRMLFSAYSASGVALEAKLKHSPGEYFSYSSGTTNLLMRLLYQQLGGDPQSIMTFVQQSFFEPMNMSHSIFEPDPSGIPVGSSYIYASARDWARLGWVMVNFGKINGTQVLDADWVKQATSGNDSGNDARYGFQFWLNGQGDTLRYSELPEDAYFMLGNRGQVVMMIPSLKLVVLRLGWSSGVYPIAEHFPDFINLAKAAADSQ